MTPANYLEEYLPPSVVQRLEAGAFRSLCSHLRDRSDQVQNIDLMTVSGFCRNCLAKWLVIEARNLSDSLKNGSSVPSRGDMGGSHDSDELHAIMQSLDAMGYNEAAQYVYGMKYEDWKDRHSQKASEETMQKFNDSKALWATYDKDLLVKRAEQPARLTSPSSSASNSAEVSGGATTSSLMSNVCCKDVDEQLPSVAEADAKKSRTREVPLYRSHLPPSLSFSLGILTVSDRAASGLYETGDLSGPAVQQAVDEALHSYGGRVALQSTHVAIVSDDVEAIQNQLKEWADDSHVDLILTTGGTGFSPRDVTPEATNLVVDRLCDGLVAFCTMECARKQPLASLSRGSAGVRGKTLIVNLPGNPKGVQEIIPVLLPLALHAVADLAIAEET